MGEVRSVHFDAFKAELPPMDGKVVVITGTTSGTGKVAAHTVASLGAKVLLLNRPSARSTAAYEELTKAFPTAKVHHVDCDLQWFTSVREAAAIVSELCGEGIDVLCNNAGVMALADEATRDGFDVQMQTNHLSHFLLTRELFPLLQRAAVARGEARIVNHSSMARMTPKKTLFAKFLEPRGGDLGGDGNAFHSLTMSGPRWLRYNQTKLANCAFTAALHHKLQASGSNVKALVAHPGFAKTDLQKRTIESGGMSGMLDGMANLAYQSMEDGAMGILSAMCLPDVASGTFYGPGSGMIAIRGRAVPFPLEPFYDNAETRELLWSKSEAAIGAPFAI